MVKVTVYVEGGGQEGKLQSKCRRGFCEFFSKAGLSGHLPEIRACGGRDDTLQRFRIALRQARIDEIPLLLVDSERDVRPNSSAWEHLSARDGWERPRDARDDQAHLMVQSMDAWFLADRTQVEKFFGAGFRRNALADRTDIENIPKDDVLSQLESASRNSQKGSYHKGRHSFDLLAQIDPNRVVQCSPYTQKLLETLRMLLNA